MLSPRIRPKAAQMNAWQWIKGRFRCDTLVRVSDTTRLAQLFLLALAGKTEGEKLAALAAFERARVASGLNLHDIADMLRPGKSPASSAPASSAEEEADGRELDVTFREAEHFAREFSDDAWPEIADWLLNEDEKWHEAHQRYLLDGRQRSFVEQMCGSARIVRPTLRQAAWLLVLFSKLAAQLTRPEPAPTPRVGNASPKLDRPNRQVPPPRPQPKPKRLTGREEQLQWISTIISARRQAPHPKHDATQPPLFSDAEARALVWYAAHYDRWLVDRSARGKSDIIVDKQPSATEIARGAHVSLRTVRRALKSAIAAGRVEIERAGKGRGKRAVYALTSPPEGWRHDSISAHRPRRQKSATYDTDSPQK